MPAPVIEDVGERMPDLARRRQDRRVIAIRKYVPGAANASPSRDRAIDALRSRDLKCLHAARELHAIGRLDDEVQMISLNTRVHDPELVVLRHRDRGPVDRVVDVALAQTPEGSRAAQRHVHRLTRSDRWPRLVPLARAWPLRWSTRTGSRATARLEQLALDRRRKPTQARPAPLRGSRIRTGRADLDQPALPRDRGSQLRRRSHCTLRALDSSTVVTDGADIARGHFPTRNRRSSLRRRFASGDL